MNVALGFLGINSQLGMLLYCRADRGSPVLHHPNLFYSSLKFSHGVFQSNVFTLMFSLDNSPNSPQGSITLLIYRNIQLSSFLRWQEEEKDE